MKAGQPRPGWWGTAGFLLAAAAATLFLYREFVFHGDRMLFGTDMLDQAYQLRKFAVDELEAGRGVPLWNPYVYGGLPFLAVLPGPVFYPTSLLYLIMPLYRAIGWTFVVHTFLSAAFGYFAGRSFGLGRWAAAVTGTSFMFGGYLLSTLYGGHDGRMFAMVLIPLAFGLLERGMRSGRAEWFLLLGLVVGAQIFTPHVQVMYFSSLALSAYALFALWLRYRAAGSLRPALSAGGLYALAFLVAALVGAVQLWPTAGLLDIAVRGVPGQEGYEFASSWALPPQELSALLLPDLIGSLNSYWGTNPFKLHTEYLGVLPLLLAAIGLASGRRRDPRPWFFAAAAVLGLLFALGAATPVHRLAYAVIPLISRFRAPAMMLGPVTFAVALLAGFGWQAIADSREGRGLPWTRILVVAGVLAVPLLAAALAPEGLIRWVFHAWFPAGWAREPTVEGVGRLRLGASLGLVVWAAALGAARAVETGRVGEWICAVALLLGAVDLGLVGGRYLIALPAEQLLPEDAGLTGVASELAPGERAWPLPDSYRPNDLMYFEIPAVTGSQNFRLEWYERLVGGLDYSNLGGRRALWSLLDLKYLTTAEQINLPFLRQVAEGSRGRVYRVSDPTPHAFFPRNVVSVGDSSAALDATLGLVDPRERAVVETWAYAGAPARSAGAEGAELSSGSGEARIRSYAPNEIVLAVTAERPGLLFVSEIYHPDWQAWIDGDPVPIHRANVAFRGVHIPEGEHELVFRFRSTALVVAGLVSATTAALTLLAVAWLTLRLRRRAEARLEERTGSA